MWLHMCAGLSMHLLPIGFHIKCHSQVWGVSLYLSMFPGFNLPNQYETMRVGKITMDKKEKSPQETESEDELPRLCPSKQEEWKHRLIEVDAVSVLLRYG